MSVAIPMVMFMLPGVFADDRTTTPVRRSRRLGIGHVMLMVLVFMVMIVVMFVIGGNRRAISGTRLSDESIKLRIRARCSLGENVSSDDLRVFKQESLVELDKWQSPIFILAESGNRRVQFVDELHDVLF